jgi:PAS domain S-box-containing protein
MTAPDSHRTIRFEEPLRQPIQHLRDRQVPENGSHQPGERAIHGQELQAVFENALDAIVIGDDIGTIIEVNDAGSELVGLPRPELVGSNLAQYLETPEEFAPILARLLADGSVSGEVRVKRSDGALRYVEFRATARVAPGRHLAIIRDQTQRKHLEEQFLRSQKMDAIGRLAGGIAHDFNNVLTIILGYCDVLRGAVQRDHPLFESVVQIDRAAQRAAALTRKLLAFSRTESQPLDLLDLNSVLNDMKPLLESLVGEQIQLALGLADRLGAVRADSGQIEQMILNLAINARDAMPRGGVLTIETAEADLDEQALAAHPDVVPGPYVALIVRDTGCGMPAEVLEHIFEPFFTTKPVGRGTGLGLSTVYGAVKQSGGHVAVESEVDRGSAFHIYLPLMRDALLSPTEASALLPPLDANQETVLLVEDESAVRSLTRHMLQTAGFRVLEATNGGEALKIGEDHLGEIDLLLTDVVMPSMDGRQLADRLRARRPRLKVLYMSGYTDEAVLGHGVLPEGSAFVEKPFTPQTLMRRMREVLM